MDRSDAKYTGKRVAAGGQTLPQRRKCLAQGQAGQAELANIFY